MGLHRILSSERPKRFLASKNCNLNFPDNQLDDLPLLQVVQSLENLIDEIQPEIIYTHSPDDLNVITK